MVVASEARRGRELSPLEVELRKIWSHHVGAGNGTLREQAARALNYRAISPDEQKKKYEFQSINIPSVSIFYQ